MLSETYTKEDIDNGFPPRPEGTLDNYDEVYNDVLDQTENFKRYYAC